VTGEATSVDFPVTPGAFLTKFLGEWPIVTKINPTDSALVRRTCARLCHSTGGELEQIQFLLGHRSVVTTERYLGSRQRILHAVNDKLGIEPDISLG